MRQYNAQPYPLIVGDDPPYLAAPGQEVDHPDLLAGFEPVDDPPADPTPPTKRASKSTANDGEVSS